MSSAWGFGGLLKAREVSRPLPGRGTSSRGRGRKQLAHIKGRCHHLACNLLSGSAGEAKEKLSKLMCSLWRLHWHSKCVEQHFGFKSSSKWQIQSPTVKVLQRCRRVSVPDHQSNFCFFSDEAQMQATCNRFSLSSLAPCFLSNPACFYLHSR